ncbi:unnamed protein product [Fusarium graminearum]|uniref:Chromosome 1, complete genome n=1 Tax=Gibberella zeae (strain ATCC MYA-4620 / CBS 123657 / FGSC 9075 / NRRL 31084 / PH-1) TaxID=229533 RepID=A0A098D105_GIBZE|nr:unnamed protein product [Fusarium graminearum]CZS75859.1 unnamed protein product [Fusarium graminearum]
MQEGGLTICLAVLFPEFEPLSKPTTSNARCHVAYIASYHCPPESVTVVIGIVSFNLIVFETLLEYCRNEPRDLELFTPSLRCNGLIDDILP